MIEYLLNETVFLMWILKIIPKAKQGLVELILKSEYESESEIVDLLLQKVLDINERIWTTRRPFLK